MSTLSGKPHSKKFRPWMGIRSEGGPIVPWRLWRSVLRRFLRQPEPVAGIPGEGSGAGEQSAPAPYQVGTLFGSKVIAHPGCPPGAAFLGYPRGPWYRYWLDPIPADVPARSILFPKEGEGIGIPCAACGKRGTVRIKPRIYGCRHCLGLSLVAIGRTGTCGFAVYGLRETPAEAAALQAAMARGTAER